jgi:hypothetical protein
LGYQQDLYRQLFDPIGEGKNGVRGASTSIIEGAQPVLDGVPPPEADERHERTPDGEERTGTPTTRHRASVRVEIPRRPAISPGYTSGYPSVIGRLWRRGARACGKWSCA